MRCLERQGNTTCPIQSFFKEKVAALGEIGTHDTHILHVGDTLTNMHIEYHTAHYH